MEEKREDKLRQSGQPIRIEPLREMASKEEIKEEKIEAMPGSKEVREEKLDVASKNEETKNKQKKEFFYQPLPLEKKKEPMPPLYVTLLIIAIILFLLNTLIFLTAALNWPVPGFIRSLLRM